MQFEASNTLKPYFKEENGHYVSHRHTFSIQPELSPYELINVEAGQASPPKTADWLTIKKFSVTPLPQLVSVSIYWLHSPLQSIYKKMRIKPFVCKLWTHRTFWSVSAGSRLWRGWTGFTAKSCESTWLKITKLWPSLTVSRVTCAPLAPLAVAIDLIKSA